MVASDLSQLPFLETLYRVIPCPVFVLALDWSVQHLNPAAETLVGKSSAESVGLPLASLLDAPSLIDSLINEAPIKEWHKADLQSYAPSLQPMQGQDGAPSAWLLILQDTSPLKKMAFNQNEFLRVTTHDLRSPLTAMRGFTEMLDSGLAGEVSDKQRYYVRKIAYGITQIASLVDNIQDAGRYDPETGFYEMTRSPVDLSEMTRNIIKAYLMPADKPLTVNVDVDPNLPIVNIDQRMIERAVVNLFDNAVKYTPANGVINLTIHRDNAHIIISVSDNGYGIPEEGQTKLFERYVRLPRKEFGRIKGTGLGLFIVRSIAQRHGGTAWVKSEDGAGATFSLSVPLDGANLINPAV